MKTIVIDDHPLITDSYVQFFENYNHDVSSFNNPEDCINYVKKNPYVDLFIVDFGLPESLNFKVFNGADLIIKLKSIVPDAKFIIITLVDIGAELYLMHLLARPNGIWYKGDVSLFTFLDNMNKVMEGFQIYTPVVQEKINAIDKFRDQIDRYDLEIISYVYKGYQNKEIADLLPMSLSNVNTRKSNMKIIFNVEGFGNIELVKKCRELNVI